MSCHMLIFIIVIKNCVSSRKFDWNWTNLDSIVKHQDKIQLYEVLYWLAYGLNDNVEREGNEFKCWV